MGRGCEVRVEGGKIVVPDRPVIRYIRADGIGPDIWRANEVGYRGLTSS